MSKLYVGNLPFSTDEESLRQLFGQDGRVVNSVAIIVDRETGRSRGFAFVEMGSPADSEAAIGALDGHDFGGRPLRVNEARERAKGPPRRDFADQRPSGFGGEGRSRFPESPPDFGGGDDANRRGKKDRSRRKRRERHDSDY